MLPAQDMLLRAGLRLPPGEREAELRREHRPRLLTNRRGVWMESSGRAPDYGDDYSPVESREKDVEPRDLKGMFDGNI